MEGHCTRSLPASWRTSLSFPTAKPTTASISYHIRTLLLFTYDQLFDTVIPCSVFGVCASLSGSTLDLPSQSPTTILARLPLAASWLWLVILQFCVQNQRNAHSVEEDAINKPWRPIPSGRITATQANNLLLVTHVVVGLASYCLNIFPIFMVYTFLITAYNDLGGGDHSGLARNLFCGAGFTCYFSGALKIAVGSDVHLSAKAMTWVAMIVLILMTTIHTQDFRDEEGDRARGRKTIITWMKRTPALWTVVAVVTLWSVYVPLFFFEAGWKMTATPVSLGASLVALAILGMKGANQKTDRLMYKLWCAWMLGFCPIPLLISIAR